MADPIYTTGDPVWNSLEDNTRVPLTSELESGWPCGQVDPALLNFVSGHGWNLIHNMLTLSGLTPSIPNLHQLAQAVQAGKVNYATTGGTANTLTATLSPVPALVAGLVVRLKISVSNTGPATLNLNALGAVPIVNRGGQPLARDQLQAGAICTFEYDGTNFQVSAPLAVLGDNLTYYVDASTGNDSDDGLTMGTAFLTIQRAIDAAATWQPNSAFIITIQCAAGAYAGFTTPSWSFPPVVVDGLVAANVTITGTQQAIMTIQGRNTVRLKRLTTSNTGNAGNERCVLAISGGVAELESVIFAGTPNTPGGSAFCLSSAGGTINNISCTIAGNAFVFFFAGASSLISLAGGTITISGSRTAVTSFVTATSLGQIAAGNATFVNPGNMTGKRYEARVNGIIDTLGGGASYFPGTVAGTVATGGQYV